jgi:hypothetical protein
MNARTRLAAGVLCWSLLVGHAAADSNVIVSPGNQNSAMTRAEARSLFLMRTRRFPDGSPVVLIQLPAQHQTHKRFVREVLNMTPEQYARERDKATNSGTAATIRFVSTTEEMLMRVARTPNSLGYVDSDNLLLNSGNNDVKVLRIID